jgi:predicted restriction endonuclease
MTDLKYFDRFPHEGVKTDLQMLMQALRASGEYEFGSSGDGELTARGRNITAYARKYRHKKGWRLTILRQRDIIFSNDMLAFESVLQAINSIEEDQLVKTPQDTASFVVADLEAIISGGTDETEKDALAKARLGQGIFRTQVLEMWEGRCGVTGSKILAAIRASHIKPWRDSDNKERLDPHNGLPLIATLDALFDAGLVTFEDNGRMLLSTRLTEDERERLALRELRLARIPSEYTVHYLEYHRDMVFSN